MTPTLDDAAAARTRILRPYEHVFAFYDGRNGAGRTFPAPTGSMTALSPSASQVTRSCRAKTHSSTIRTSHPRTPASFA